jgi:2-iminobutanoate/2-iminopropanoate deaminase
MEKQLIRSDKIGGTYSRTTVHGVRAGDFVFVTGQIANQPGTQPADTPHERIDLGTIEQQTERVIENVKAILEEAGTDLAHVVKRNVYMTHLSDYEPIYKVMERYFPEPVASTGVIAGLIPHSARVEIDVIAVMP